MVKFLEDLASVRSHVFLRNRDSEVNIYLEGLFSESMISEVLDGLNTRGVSPEWIDIRPQARYHSIA